MVEGHAVHRLAAAHRRQLVGKAFRATSPNGRFTDGAKAVDSRPLTRVEAVGKNLFYFFGAHAPSAPLPAVVHVHFGMAGRFSTHKLPGPESKPTTRLRLESEEHNLCALLSAMTVQLGGPELFEEKREALGQDPLREDADVQKLWSQVQRSGKSIGLALMDQAMFAGVGNIYRAEICYKAGLHPEQPCKTLDREQFDRVWHHSVDLLQRGFQTGSILTVDPEEAKVLGPPWTRRYVYNQSRCGRCGAAVNTWDMAARTAYACAGACQPLLEGTTLAGAAAGKLKGARQHVQFVSHCAPDPPKESASLSPARLTVAQLKEELTKLGVAVPVGKKAVLVAALEAAVGAAPGPEEASAASGPKTGTRHLKGEMASAAEAAAEKVRAGEGANVEHVALVDDASEAVVAKGRKRRAPEGVKEEAAGKAPAKSVREMRRRKQRGE